jgi:hypothetical protein
MGVSRGARQASHSPGFSKISKLIKEENIPNMNTRNLIFLRVTVLS